jgi:hypothetical protein
VDGIGRELMENYVLPFEVLGLLLTAAMIGAALIAMRERSHPSNLRNDSAKDNTHTASPLTPATDGLSSRRGSARSPLRGEGEDAVPESKLVDKGGKAA